MVCSVCNTENNYYHKYCYNCGSKIDQSVLNLPDDQVWVTDGVRLNIHRETFNPYRDKKRVKKALKYSALVSSIIIVGMVFWIVLK